VRKDKTPKELVMDILYRSNCRVKVGAVIVDRKGSIMSWGWNHTKMWGSGTDGTDWGCHAEAHAIMRANPKRLNRSTIYVAGLYSKNLNPVCAKPCENCATMIEKMGIGKVVYLDRKDWVSYGLGDY